MWFYAVGAALVLYLFTRKRGLPSHYGTDDGDGLYINEATPEGKAIHAAVLTYGRTGEGKLEDGTIWIEGSYGTGKPAGDSGATSNIYARARQHSGDGNTWWTLAWREDIDAIASGNPPAKMKLIVTSLDRIRETGMAREGGKLVIFG